MIEIDISTDQLDRARKKAVEMGKIPNSITNGGGSLAGFIGEVVVADILKIKHDNTYNYDLVNLSGKKIDVKTKRCNSQPQKTYDCSISAHGTKQECDSYIFVRVLNNLSRAWVLGEIDKQEYFDKARFCKKGDIDPDNGFNFKADCYNVKIADLIEINATQ